LLVLSFACSIPLLHSLSLLLSLLSLVLLSFCLPLVHFVIRQFGSTAVSLLGFMAVVEVGAGVVTGVMETEAAGVVVVVIVEVVGVAA
jgi:hypothetical protein